MKTPGYHEKSGERVFEGERDLGWEDQRRLLRGGGGGAGTGVGGISVRGCGEGIPGSGNIRTKGRGRRQGVMKRGCGEAKPPEIFALECSLWNHGSAATGLKSTQLSEEFQASGRERGSGGPWPELTQSFECISQGSGRSGAGIPRPPMEPGLAPR